MNQSLTFGPWKLNKNHTKQSITRSMSVDEIHTTFELGNTKALIKKGAYQSEWTKNEKYEWRHKSLWNQKKSIQIIKCFHIKSIFVCKTNWISLEILCDKRETFCDM